MRNLRTFEECCNYLNIPTDLPKCYVREKQFQAAYKLSVCMMAWNKQDGFEPDEKAVYYQKNAGYTPHFNFKDGRLLPSGSANNGSMAGIISAIAGYAATSIGLRLCFKSQDRSVEFGKTFIDIFNELI